MSRFQSASFCGLVLIVGSLLTSCSPGKVREGCIREKMREMEYTEEYARAVCEAEYEIYGDKQSPIDKAINEFDNAINEFNEETAVFECKAQFDFDPAFDEICEINRVSKITSPPKTVAPSQRVSPTTAQDRSLILTKQRCQDWLDRSELTQDTADAVMGGLAESADDFMEAFLDWYSMLTVNPGAKVSEIQTLLTDMLKLGVITTAQIDSIEDLTLDASSIDTILSYFREYEWVGTACTETLTK